MTRFEYGDPASANILIQMVDDHDLSVIENEAKAIKAEAGGDFRLVALKVEDWNRDLSPWKAPAVFGNEDFGDGAEETLAKVLDAGKTDIWNTCLVYARSVWFVKGNISLCYS